MNKTKIILAVTGGAIGLVVLGMALLVWNAYCGRTVAFEGDEEEGIDGLETVLDKAQTLSGKTVYPCAASVAAIDSNRTLVATWQEGARKLAERGDRAFEQTTPAAFKAFIVADARRLSGLPGAAEGRLAKPTFEFGPFKDYISGGKLPAEAELAVLQRRWDDVATVAGTLADSGIAELTDVQFKEKKGEKDGSDAKDRKEKRGRKDAGGKDGKAPASATPQAFTYVFAFTAKPSAFVAALNALETGERFVVVEDFTVAHPNDTLVALLGGEGQKSEAKQATSGRRGRRRGGESASSPKDGEASSAPPQNVTVTDPSADSALLTATLTVTVHDFGSRTGAAASTPLEEEKK